MTTENTKENKKKDKLICPRCKYEWKFKGKMFYATCPRCMYKYKVV